MATLLLLVISLNSARGSSTFVSPAVFGGDWSCGGNGLNCQSASNAFGGGGDCCDEQSHAYACVDWSVGSLLLSQQECTYKNRTGEDVTFGVGSFGTTDQNNMGKCYKMALAGSAATVIAQVVNTGTDVHDKQFDLQQMAGGVGLCNALTGSATFSDGDTSGTARFPMFAGSNDPWGPNRYGGFNDESGCSGIPSYPDGTAGALAAFDNGESDLQTMCRAAFARGTRVNGGANPTIETGQRVACPVELYAVTGLRLTSDDTFTDSEAFTNGGLTRMWDGCKPSAGWEGNVVGADSEYKAVVPCGPDGISRVTVAARNAAQSTALAACVGTGANTQAASGSRQLRPAVVEPFSGQGILLTATVLAAAFAAQQPARLSCWW